MVDPKLVSVSIDELEFFRSLFVSEARFELVTGNAVADIPGKKLG